MKLSPYMMTPSEVIEIWMALEMILTRRNAVTPGSTMS